MLELGFNIKETSSYTHKQKKKNIFFQTAASLLFETQQVEISQILLPLIIFMNPGSSALAPKRLMHLSSLPRRLHPSLCKCYLTLMTSAALLFFFLILAYSPHFSYIMTPPPLVLPR